MEYVKENGDKVNVKGLTVTVELGDETMSKINEIRREIASVAEENEKLRELLVGAYEDMDAWQKVIASSDQWGYGKGCLDRLYELRNAMRELGIEVDE